MTPISVKQFQKHLMTAETATKQNNNATKPKKRELFSLGCEINRYTVGQIQPHQKYPVFVVLNISRQTLGQETNAENTMRPLKIEAMFDRN